MSLVFKLMLFVLLVMNLCVVVFIPSFPAVKEDRLIKSFLFGIGKLKGSIFALYSKQDALTAVWFGASLILYYNINLL